MLPLCPKAPASSKYERDPGPCAIEGMTVGAIHDGKFGCNPTWQLDERLSQRSRWRALWYQLVALLAAYREADPQVARGTHCIVLLT